MLESPEHVPARSFWPLLLAVGIACIIIGILVSLILSAAGVVITLVALGGWTMENRERAHPVGGEDDGELYHE